MSSVATMTDEQAAAAVAEIRQELPAAADALQARLDAGERIVRRSHSLVMLYAPATGARGFLDLHAYRVEGGG